MDEGVEEERSRLNARRGRKERSTRALGKEGRGKGGWGLRSRDFNCHLRCMKCPRFDIQNPSPVAHSSSSTSNGVYLSKHSALPCSAWLVYCIRAPPSHRFIPLYSSDPELVGESQEGRGGEERRVEAAAWMGWPLTLSLSLTLVWCEQPQPEILGNGEERERRGQSPSPLPSHLSLPLYLRHHHSVPVPS